MNDEELGEILRAVLAAADPVPQAAVQAAQESIGWRDPDSELARLDSEPVLQPAHLRGRPSRLLTFRTGSIIIDLEVSEADGQVRLLGQLDPPQAADVAVQSASGSRNLRADNQGRFAVEGLPDGWMRVLVTSGNAEGGRVTTEWFRP